MGEMSEYHRDIGAAADEDARIDREDAEARAAERRAEIRDVIQEVELEPLVVAVDLRLLVGMSRLLMRCGQALEDEGIGARNDPFLPEDLVAKLDKKVWEWAETAAPDLAEAFDG